MKWFVTSFAVGKDYQREMACMIESLRKFHPDVSVIAGSEPVESGEWGDVTCYKAEWIRSVWNAFHDRLGDLVWIDADARIVKPIIPPFSDDHPRCFGARNYWTNRRRNGWSTGTLWLHGNVGQWIDRWCNAKGKDDEEMLTKVPDIRFVELGDKMAGLCSKTPEGYGSAVIPDSSIIHWNMSRKKLGKVKNWPPSEKEREDACSCNNADVQPSGLD